MAAAQELEQVRARSREGGRPIERTPGRRPCATRTGPGGLLGIGDGKARGPTLISCRPHTTPDRRQITRFKAMAAALRFATRRLVGVQRPQAVSRLVEEERRRLMPSLVHGGRQPPFRSLSASSEGAHVSADPANGSTTMQVRSIPPQAFSPSVADQLGVTSNWARILLSRR
jgi:hypothetical protein